MANDTQVPVAGTLVYGSLALDGRTEELREKRFTCPALTRKVIATFNRRDEDPSTTLWIARVQGDPAIWPAILRVVDLRQMKMTPPQLKVKVARAGKGAWRVRVSSDVFAHAVHLDLPEGAQCSDDYFDLLPGEGRDVRVTYDGTLSVDRVAVTSVVCTGS
jgi:hypothetical protein